MTDETGEPNQVPSDHALSDQVPSDHALSDHAREEGRVLTGPERARLAALDALGNALVLTDWRLPDSPIVYHNAAFERLTGYGADEIDGRNCRFLQGPATDSADVARVRQALAQGRPLQTTILNYRKDGTPFWNELAIAPVPDAAGAVTHYVGVQTDVTAHKDVQQALSASERRFRAVTDLVPDFLWQSAPDGAIHWYNERWTEYTGQTREQALGWGWIDAIHPDDREASARRYREAVERGVPLRREHRIRRRDGQYRWFVVNTFPLRDDGGRVVTVYGAATDIHERHALQETLTALVAERTKELEERTESLARSNGELAQQTERVQELLRQVVNVQEAERARLSRELHDQFGQRITGFMLGITALAAGQPSGSEAATLAARLREAAAGLSHEVHQMAWELRPPALDDMGLSAALSTYVRDWGERTGVAADFHDGHGERLFAEAETALYRIAQEALTNIARHASGAERVSVVLEVRGSQIHLVIEDDGPGFDPAAERSGRLGLRGMRERAALLGGTLEVETAPGEGTTLFVRIPIQPLGSEEGDHG